MKASRKSAPGPGSRHQPEQTRLAILDAAEREFACQGLEGARTDAIARAAGVNKALLYYYFKGKEGLYAAVLDRVFGGLKAAIEAALQPALAPSEKVLAYVGAHFDYIAGKSRLTPRLIERELLHETREGSARVSHICTSYFTPIFSRLARIIAEGIAAGEFRPVDPMQFLPSMVAVIVFYFAATPVLKQLAGVDPLSPERLAVRRAAVLDFISSALFRPGLGALPRRARKGVKP